VDGREILHDLNAAAVPMHVAEAADVHQDVEAKLLARGKCTRQFVVLPAMTQPEVDDLAAARLAGRFDLPANLAEGIMTVPVNERGGKFDLERVVTPKIIIQ